jgi:ubiquinone/menaquinone biosynthesis C-methylase UbiE
MAPDASSAENSDWFDEAFEAWLGWLIPGGPSSDELLKLAGLEAASRILDVGCGTGRLLAHAARREPTAVLAGVDIDRDSITIARERARNSRARIEFHLTSAERMPFVDDSFDAVIVAFVLNGLRKVAETRALREIFRVLKPTGRIIVLDWVHPGCAPMRVASDLFTLIPVLGRARSPFDGALAEAGYARAQTRREYWTAWGAMQIVASTKPSRETDPHATM